MHLSNGDTLLFKMHGRRSNLLLFHENDEPILFRNNLPIDKEITLSSLGRSISIESPSDDDLRQLQIVLGKELVADSSPTPDDLLQLAHNLLDKHRFYLVEAADRPPYITWSAHPEVTFESADPLEISSALYRAFTGRYLFNEQKNSLARLIERQIKKTENYLIKSRKELDSLKERRSYEELANIVMANLHVFQPEILTTHLDDFYSSGKVTIKLKPGVKPQKHAENLYRKAKNQRLQSESIIRNIESKEELLLSLLSNLEELSQLSTFKELNQFSKRHGLLADNSAKEEILPYREVVFEGYQIWIGKNAKSNDLLTLRHAKKDDLWLHARDVPGSHVVIKKKGTATIPKSVIEKAASFAAYYSKRKTDSLCPVMATPKKYVRKRKGAPAGSVIVDREESILAKPESPIID